MGQAMQNATIYGIGLALVLLSKDGEARWNHHNADTLDRVTGLGVEYYNDILSYRDPSIWEANWSATRVGFRSAAGSLNKKEFLYQQSLKLRTSEDDPWQLAFTSDRSEEPRSVRSDSALELSYGAQQKSWRFGILADGSTEKAFADLGMKLDYEPVAGSRWQLIGWSVDTFYNEKKLQREDYRTRHPWSWELLVSQSWSRSTLRLQHKQDQPVDWYLVSKDQRYAYQWQLTDLYWQYNHSEIKEIFVQLTQVQERESLEALSRPILQGYQDIRSTVEVGQRIQQGQESISYALWGLWETTQKQQVLDESVLDDPMGRHEAALLWNWSRPFWEGLHQQHWGLTINQVNVDEEKYEHSTEVKLNWGPDFVLGQHGRMRLTSTWDLDQLARDFPFTRHGFHPWGGGQASFLMTF